MKYIYNKNVYYYKNNAIILHRIDGPAIEYANGSKYWYIEGKHIKVSSQEEFEKFLKLKAFW